ncbi:MAG: M48 family metallopeptidase [Verrucomicrobia bacterium]|nr:M48 family metallopeptidase [Verrucomicrobiota bacterium]MBU1735415.1 M48 family metallopeptidase [Verrucomicrobiota bacterium]MBU1857430.1 M48 family metallopeptidase [Verrucomicrobiota bacterium]
MSAALFNYTVRESLRSRCIRLQVTPRRGLEVVVPRGCSRARIPPLLEKKRQWIRSALERVEAYRARFPPAPVWQVPERITFPAIQRAWQVEMHPEEISRVTVQEHGEGLLKIRGNVGQSIACSATADPAIACQAIACRAALHRWWLRQGRKHLVPMLREISRETGWSFDRATVRRQRTRWGSCSRRKSVSLNAKLLFLDPALVRYVMIHELCHTKEMNHAPRFWRLVQTECPDFRVLNKTLRQAWNTVPAWAGSEYE